MGYVYGVCVWGMCIGYVYVWGICVLGMYICVAQWDMCIGKTFISHEMFI